MSIVSIITPCHNSAQFISEAIESVLKQSFSEWEMIVVDDCSSDNSVELIRFYIKQDSRIKLIELAENSGAAVARNSAIDASLGPYIAFLDSDDLWQADKLKKQIEFMQANDSSFSYSAYEKIDEKGGVIGGMGVPEKISYIDLLKTNSIGCSTAIYDSHKLGKIYMSTNTKREDFASWLQILKKVDYAYGINEILAQYRVYSTQNSAKKLKMAKENWRLYRDIEKLGLFKSAYYFSHYAVRGALRTKFPLLAHMLGVLK